MIFFDAFLDLYYAYNLNQPVTEKRVYTTQPLYHSRPSINLAHLGLNVNEDKFRGRFALQGGDAVKANTILEANRKLGHIQEAYMGVKINQNTWIDGGIYLGHIGMESWISERNLTYSRSLLLDYVPYYSLGLRLSHKRDEDTSIEIHVMNGWQNISETNEAKSLGFQLKKKAGLSTFTYNNFLGDERVYSSQKNRFRTYHNFILERTFWAQWKGAFSWDLGTKAQEDKRGIETWHAAAFVLGRKINETQSFAVRLEHYADPHQCNVQTFSRNGFLTQSASFNFDQKLKKVLWRNEIRAYKSKDSIYPAENKFKSSDQVIVTSISFSL